LLTIPLALCLTAVAAGCTTFSDSDAVARVGDVELGRDEFEDRLEDLGATDDDVLALDPVRAEITTWIQLQLVGSEELAAIYDAGPDESGVTCFSAIVVEDEPTAVAVQTELEDGAAFDEVFVRENLDPSLAEAVGALPCITAEDIEASADVAFVAVGVTLNAENPFGTAPVADTTGATVAWVTLAFRSFDELSEEDVVFVTRTIGTLEGADPDVDIYVDPRYGVWDTLRSQVVPLG
jgi:hypothetical protein